MLSTQFPRLVARAGLRSQQVCITCPNLSWTYERKEEYWRAKGKSRIGSALPHILCPMLDAYPHTSPCSSIERARMERDGNDR